MIETLANGYSSESTQWELSNEYQHDRVWKVFKNVCALVLWTKVASALEGNQRFGDILSVKYNTLQLNSDKTATRLYSLFDGLLYFMSLIANKTKTCAIDI